MISLLLLSILISLSIGFLLSYILLPAKLTLNSLFIKVSLSVGLGFGISSSIFFLCLLVFRSSNNAFIIVEALFIIFFAIILYIIRLKRRPISEVTTERITKLRVYLPILVLFLVMLASSIVILISLSLKNPHGSWDAWAIWNMRARFLFRGGEQWRDAFSNILSWSHPDYPLLIPGLIARCWKYVGNETIAIPALISILFTLATLLLMIFSISLLRSRTQGLLAGIVLLGTPFFITVGASQYADIPLGFFFLATIVLFCFQNRFKENNFSLLLLTGAMAGFAAWTKNEGISFLLSIVIAHFVATIAIKDFRTYLKEIFPLVTGFMPMLIIIAYFKMQLAPPSDLLASGGFDQIVRKLTDPSRYLNVARAFINQLIWFGNGFVIVLAIYLFLLGKKSKQEDKTSITISFFTLGIMLLAYFFIYIIIPYDLNWALGTSLPRLLLQMWPSLIFVYFMIVSTPGSLLRWVGEK